jgi:hypothetical protein
MEVRNKSKIIRIVKKKESLSVSAAITENIDLEKIFREYAVDDNQKRDVEAFLASNPDLAPVLIEAKPHLERIFGQVPYYLRLEHDPEEEYDELSVFAKVRKTPIDAINLMDQFDKEWLVPFHSNVMGRLNFDTELYE